MLVKVKILPVVLLALTVACSDTFITIPTAPGQSVPVNPANPANPTNPNQPVTGRSTIEFRVNGNPLSVRVRYSTQSDGLAQVVTTLPFTNSFATAADSVFLSLDATPISYSFLTIYPFLSAQIFANGVLFREATSNDFLLNTLAVSGTWRR